MAVFCTEDELNLILSEWGVRNSSDDDKDQVADDGVVDSCIERAHVRLMQYLEPQYAEADLVGNAFAKWTEAVIACVMLMRRKGEGAPDGLINQYDEAIEFLKEIKAGSSVVPGVQKEVNDYVGITMSNYHMDMRRRVGQCRVAQRISVGPLTGGGKPRFWDDYAAVLIEP
jgi:phage gp36-like protein